MIVYGLECFDKKFSKQGVYRLQGKKNRRGVWKRDGDNVYIYYHESGRWIFGKKRDMDSGNKMGWIFAESGAISPDRVETDWNVYYYSHDLRRLGNVVKCSDNWNRCGWRKQVNLQESLLCVILL